MSSYTFHRCVFLYILYIQFYVLKCEQSANIISQYISHFNLHYKIYVVQVLFRNTGSGIHEALCARMSQPADIWLVVK